MGLFERKESPKQTKSSDSMFWTVLQWFWVLVPLVYFLLYLPGLTQTSENPVIPVGQIFRLFTLSFNLALGGIMFMMEPAEKSRNGAADVFLKMAFAQQIITGQLFGIILVGLSWFKLPTTASQATVNPKDSDNIYLSAKTIYIITGLILIFTILVVAIRWLL